MLGINAHKSRNFERSAQKRRDGKLHFAQKTPPRRCSHRVRGCGSAGKFAAGQAVKVQHSFQCGNVGVHVQRIGLEQLVQLVFKGGH